MDNHLRELERLIEAGDLSAIKPYAATICRMNGHWFTTISQNIPQHLMGNDIYNLLDGDISICLRCQHVEVKPSSDIPPILYRVIPGPLTYQVENNRRHWVREVYPYRSDRRPVGEMQYYFTPLCSMSSAQRPYTLQQILDAPFEPPTCKVCLNLNHTPDAAFWDNLFFRIVNLYLNRERERARRYQHKDS